MDSLEVQPLWIGGREWGDASGGSFVVRNPYSGEVAARVGCGGELEADQAVAAATQALRSWAGLAGNDRANILYRTYHLLRIHKERLVALLVEDQGKTVREAAKEVRSTGAFIRFCAEEARRISGDLVSSPDPRKRVVVVPQPVGVVAAFTAANGPGIIFGRKVAPALAAGCTVVVKPAEEAPRLPLALARLFEEAGLPAGALNVIAGDAPAIARTLMRDSRVRMVSFTGSARLGRELMRMAADGMKRLVLELGGVAPFLVFADADLEACVAGLVAAKFRHSGQICASPQRVLVEASVADTFQGLLLARVAALRIGDPSDPATDYGPLQHERIMRRVEALIEDARSKGARVLTGAQVLRPLTYAPTVLTDVADHMEVLREEAFGPIIVLERFSREEEAIARSNDTAYGLGAYVYTRDLTRAWRVAEALEVGVVGVNDPFPATVEGPFGGVKGSGFGLEGGRYGVEQYLIKKQISFQL